MKHLRIALILGCMPASPVLADSLEREEALKLPQTLITGNRQVQARSDSSFIQASGQELTGQFRQSCRDTQAVQRFCLGQRRSDYRFTF